MAHLPRPAPKKAIYGDYITFSDVGTFCAGRAHLNRQAQLPSSRAGQPDIHRGKRDSRGIQGLAAACAIEGARSLDCARDDRCVWSFE